MALKISILDALKFLTMGEAQIVEYLCQKRDGAAQGKIIGPLVTALLDEAAGKDPIELQALVDTVMGALTQAESGGADANNQ